MLADVAPVLHTYPRPPDAVRVVEAPAQTDVDPAETLIDGTVSKQMLLVTEPHGLLTLQRYLLLFKPAEADTCKEADNAPLYVLPLEQL